VELLFDRLRSERVSDDQQLLRRGRSFVWIVVTFSCGEDVSSI
jgi:hypothetical protein